MRTTSGRSRPAQEIVFRLDRLVDDLDTVARLVAGDDGVSLSEDERRRMRVLLDRVSRVVDELFDVATSENETAANWRPVKMDLKDGVANPEGAKLFAEGLADCLYGNGDLQARFESFADTLFRIKAANWPVATYFLFLAHPDENLFLKPVVTQAAADACGFDLKYDAELNWRTYEALLRFGAALRTIIGDLKPRDMIDIQSFIWCIGERV